MKNQEKYTHTHCYGHSLNLAASDAIRNSKLMKDALDTTHEITKLIKFSPRREAMFRANRRENDMLTDSSSSAGIRVLCPTRWTVRADSLFSVIANYTILMNTWDEATRVARDMETKARILGVQSQMKKFSFIFGVYLGEMILWHSDNLSKTLQSNTICAAERQNVAGMVVRTLEKLRSSEVFDLFWQKVTDMQFRNPWCWRTRSASST